MTDSIELGGLGCDGHSVGRPYEDRVSGITGKISASIRGNQVRVEYQEGGEEEPHHADIDVGSPEAAERTITEEFAAIQAIGGVLEEAHGATA